MRLYSVFLLCLCLLLVCSLVAGGKKKKVKKRARAGKWTCDKAGQHTATPKNFGGKGLKVKCKRKGLIASMSLLGHNGTCQGLPAHLFVEMNKCYWQRDCILKYTDQFPTNYMLKLYQGHTPCVVKTPDYFTMTYDCANKKAKVFDLPREKDKKIKAKLGILRSHADHPWMYKKTELPENLTLVRPKKSYTFFVFTIQTLSLDAGDSLSYAGYDDNGALMTDADPISREVSTEDNVKTRTFNIGNSPSTVTFTLDAAHHTTGGEGFVLCFKWTTKLETNACKKIIQKQKCKSKKPRKG